MTAPISHNPIGDRRTLDVAKGVLILLIVLGHNDILMRQMPWLREFIYNWHVYGFFLLAALAPVSSTRLTFLRDRAVRYLVPFAVFFTGVVVVRSLAGGLTIERLADWAAGLVFGSADLVDKAGAGRLFWFLPTLMGLTVFKWIAARYGRRGWASYAILGVLGFLSAGLLPKALVAVIPFGLPIAAYTILPGEAFRQLTTRVFKRPERIALATTGAAAVFALANIIVSGMGTRLVLASLDVHDVLHPVPLVTHAVLAVSGTLTAVLASHYLSGSVVLQRLGSASLIIYLSHQIIYVPLRAATLAELGAGSGGIIVGGVLFALSVTLSYAVAMAISRIDLLQRLITPRDWPMWRDALLLRRGG